MRLFDKIASQGPTEVRESVRKISPTVFAVDEIAKHYYQNERMMWGSEDYPYARPPWPVCFVEWNEPEWALMEDGRADMNPSDQGGVMVTLFDAPGNVDATVKFIQKITQREIQEVPPNAEMTALLTPFCFVSGRLYVNDFRIAWFMNGDGRIERFVTFGRDADKLDRHCRTITHILGLSFTFANCSNVKLEDVTDEMQPSPKIMRRLKLPCVKRYTLNIAGHSTNPRTKSDGPVQEGIMPFHLCRGHFATYTAERPLFGRHVGRFWIPPHTRGREERGKIEKDYAATN